MITVGIREGKNLYVDGIMGSNDQTIFNINRGETKVISDSIMRDNSIRAALLKGDLVLKDGKVNFMFKGAKCYISSKKNNRAYILENGKLLVKDLEKNTYITENLSEEFIQKMTAKMMEA